jgi:hypothetical protein
MTPETQEERLARNLRERDMEQAQADIDSAEDQELRLRQRIARMRRSFEKTYGVPAQVKVGRS